VSCVFDCMCSVGALGFDFFVSLLSCSSFSSFFTVVFVVDDVLLLKSHTFDNVWCVCWCSCVCVYACIRMCVCVCSVFVRERERERGIYKHPSKKKKNLLMY